MGLAVSQSKVRKFVKYNGVALTVAGCELSRVVTPEPMSSYTNELKSFLLSKLGVKMTQIQPLNL